MGSINMSETMTVESGGVPDKAAVQSGEEFWCNFCDFRTNDLPAYLAHSCKDVLAERGVEIVPTGRNECG
jgi:hypothetical protein